MREPLMPERRSITRVTPQLAQEPLRLTTPGRWMLALWWVFNGMVLMLELAQ